MSSSYGPGADPGERGSGRPAGAPAAGTAALRPGGQGAPDGPGGRDLWRQGSARLPPERLRPPLQTAPAARSTGGRRARLALKRIDPWSVFRFTLVASILLGVMFVVAVAALDLVLSSAGVLRSVNTLISDIAQDSATGRSDVLTTGRLLGAAALLSAVDVVLLTALATLGAFLYNLCASFTGGVEVTLGERD